MPIPDTPALDKLAANADYIEHIEQFMEYLQENAHYIASEVRLPTHYDLVYGAIGLNVKQIEKERKMLLQHAQEKL